MVIDTSVIAAILFGEDDAERFATAIENDPTRLMSSGSVLEASLVIESELGEEGTRELDLLLHTAAIEIIAFTVDQLKVARHAWWLGVFPGLAIMIAVLSINFPGDALRDLLDVRESRELVRS